MQMKNSLLAPLILCGVAGVAIAAYAGTRTGMNPWQDYADVVSVELAFDDQQTARQACNAEAVNKIQKHMREGNTETVGEQRCGVFYDNHVVPAGFDVTYRLNGKQNVVRMDHDPGKRIRVEDGELDLSRS